MPESPSSGKRNWLYALSIGVAACLLIALLIPRANDDGTIQGETMGTTYTVRFLKPDKLPWEKAHTERLAREIARCLSDVNAKMSTYTPDSELSRFNESPAHVPFELSPETFEVFEAALAISAESAGAFDITVGPLVNAYGFGPPPEPPALPTGEQLEALRQRVGYRLLALDPPSRTILKPRADVYCDLSGIAKGYAVDRVAEVMKAHGLTDYMVEVGGEVRVRGLNPDGMAWRIGIERPTRDGTRVVMRAVELVDRALATSGDYRNYYIVDGRVYSHMIDPRTAMPVDHALASVTVLDQKAMIADGWATALMVLGPDEGYNLAEARGMAALFLVRTADGNIAERFTTAFAGLTVGPGKR
ncbi:MAG: FAD:protein FMN transferase [Phycisphaerae bacterium]|nr:FAD:protein FMN transferase [Phycisphaerae bacterium]